MTKEETSLPFIPIMMRSAKVSRMMLLLLPCLQAVALEEVRSGRWEVGGILENAVHSLSH
jgi:hypothetical protein